MDKIILVLIGSILTSCGQERPPQNCAILKQGIFKYLDDIGDASAYFVIRNGVHTEYHKNGQYHIESSLKWTGECEYETQMLNTNYETFPFKKGDKMKIQITQVDGDTIYYTATVNERSRWNSKVLRVGN